MELSVDVTADSDGASHADDVGFLGKNFFGLNKLIVWFRKAKKGCYTYHFAKALNFTLREGFALPESFYVFVEITDIVG